MFIVFNLNVKMDSDQEKLFDKMFCDTPFSKKTRTTSNKKKTIYYENIMVPVREEKTIVIDKISNFVNTIIKDYKFDNEKQKLVVKNSLEYKFSNEKHVSHIDELVIDMDVDFKFINPVMDKNIKILYSDGSYNTGTKVGGYGVCELLEETQSGESVDILTGRSYDYKTYSGNTGDQIGTNNIGELMGISKSLDVINNSNNEFYVIISDSEYSIKSMREWIHNWKNNGWRTYSKKPIKNKELIVEIFDKIDTNKNIMFCWTKAHVNQFFNEKCDTLAKESVGI